LLLPRRTLGDMPPGIATGFLWILDFHGAMGVRTAD
jgi:hypothetical protein